MRVSGAAASAHFHLDERGGLVLVKNILNRWRQMVDVLPTNGFEFLHPDGGPFHRAPDTVELSFQCSSIVSIK